MEKIKTLIKEKPWIIGIILGAVVAIVYYIYTKATNSSADTADTAVITPSAVSYPTTDVTGGQNSDTTGISEIVSSMNDIITANNDNMSDTLKSITDTIASNNDSMTKLVKQQNVNNADLISSIEEKSNEQIQLLKNSIDQKTAQAYQPAAITATVSSPSQTSSHSSSSLPSNYISGHDYTVQSGDTIENIIRRRSASSLTDAQVKAQADYVLKQNGMSSSQYVLSSGQHINV